MARHCEHYDYNAAFTSNLERARETLLVILSRQQKLGYFKHGEIARYTHFAKAPKDFITKALPIFASEKLNERYYGDLQGIQKDEAAQEFGKEVVIKWRRGYRDVPPNGESLHDVYQRVVPYFEKYIHPRVKDGETVLVVAHGNTLRSAIKFLEQINDERIAFVDLPTGLPLVYSCEGDVFHRTEGEYRFIRPLR